MNETKINETLGERKDISARPRGGTQTPLFCSTIQENISNMLHHLRLEHN